MYKESEMKKYFLLMLSFVCLLFSCTQQIPMERNSEEVNQVKEIKKQFVEELEVSLCDMSETAKTLLNSSVFNQSSYSSKGIIDDNDDKIFELLSDEEKKIIEEKVKNYLKSLSEAASKITVFDKGLPDGCEETDEYVIINNVMYSKMIPETLENALILKDELYSGKISKGAKQWLTCRWNLIGVPKGNIYYSYNGNFSENEKRVIRSCMDEWQNTTGSAVTFIEKNLNWWGELKWALGITRNVKFKKVSGKDYYVNASLGNAAWAYFNVNTDKMFRTNGDPIVSDYHKRITRHALLHELGHVICLQNEYERTDRDKFIQLCTGETTFPGTSGIVRWLQKLVMTNYGSYDYKSVMNESDQYSIIGTDRLITLDDIENISHNDVLTVKYIYDVISKSEMESRWEDTEASLTIY